MCVVHNAMVRGLNSIVIQGPNIQPADYTDFIGYSLCWHAVVHEHHTSEEDQFFPDIEKAVGEKGLLDSNVEEHRKYTLLSIFQSIAYRRSDQSWHLFQFGNLSLKNRAELIPPKTPFKPASTNSTSTSPA